MLIAASSGAYVSQKGTAFDDIEIVGLVAMAPADIAVLAPTTSTHSGFSRSDDAKFV